VTKYLRSHLGAKLFLSYVAVIGIGALMLVLATRLTLPSAFDRHLGSSTQQIAMQATATAAAEAGEAPPERGNGFGAGGANTGENAGSGGGANRYGDVVGGGYGQELFQDFVASFKENTKNVLKKAVQMNSVSLRIALTRWPKSWSRSKRCAAN
jgi:hypothetical protein